MASTTIQIRIDSPTKARAQKAFKSMGIDLSSGIKYFLVKVGKEKNLQDASDLRKFILSQILELKGRNYKD